MFSNSSIRPTEARVSLSGLAHNYRLLRQSIGPQVGIIAVVKADAYGHGAVPISRLLEGLGVRGFGVSTVDEGVELRRAGIRAPIIVMGAAFGKDHAEVIHHDLIPVVGDRGDVDEFAQAAKLAGKIRFSIHVKVDTGMSRLGITEANFDGFIRHCARHLSLRVDGLATHFASADHSDPQPTDEQLQMFIRCLNQARSMGADPQVIHAANTAAAIRFPKTRFDVIRPGLALYGTVPSPYVPNPGFQSVLSFHTRINALREIKPGTGISYGSTFVAQRRSIIATLPVGYADGYPRSLSNRAQVLIRGHRAPIVGTICMDLCMVDVTDIIGVQVGDPVILLGSDGEHSITIDELASWAGTISYELLTGISKRVPRLYPEINKAFE